MKNERKVKGKYQAYNSFIHTVGSSAAEVQYEQVSNWKHQRCTSGLPDISRMHTHGRTTYFEQMVSQIVSNLFTPSTQPTSDDYIDLNVHAQAHNFECTFVETREFVCGGSLMSGQLVKGSFQTA